MLVPMTKREMFAAALPYSLLPREGLVSLIQDCYRVPGNAAEAEAHAELLGRGAVVLRRGWPDFLVFEREKLYVVEVKGPGDDVRPSQQVVLAALARQGISTYVRRSGPQHASYEPVGDSEEWDYGR